MGIHKELQSVKNIVHITEYMYICTDIYIRFEKQSVWVLPR